MIVVDDSCSRLDSPWSRRPRSLEPVANQPIVHHVLGMLAAAGIREAVAVCPPEADDVHDCIAAWERRNQLQVHYLEQRPRVDLEGALKLAAPIVGNAPCLVHLATGLLGQSLEPLLARLDPGSPDMIVAVHQGPAPDGHLSAETQRMLHLAELDPDRAPLSLAGVLLFGPGGLACVSSASLRHGNEIDLTSAAMRIAAAGGRLTVLPLDAWRRFAGDPLDLLELNRIALDRLERDQRPTNNGNRIEGRVWIDETALVRASVIVGPAVIGPHARVSDAYIGPYTSIGAGAKLEGVEIERSIVAPGATITHIGGRLVTSVVGSNARVFRDFSLPRAFRLRIGDGTEIALC